MTNSVHDAVGDASLSLPASWAVASAEIVDRLEEPILPELMIRFLHTLLPFEYGVIFIYRDNAMPVHVCNTFANPTAKVGLGNFLKQTYVLNPFYNAYCNGLKTGAYRMSDLTPDHFFDAEWIKQYRISVTPKEEIGYITEGWPAGHREMCIAVEMPFGECAAISLARRVADGRFSSDELSRMGFAAPFLAAAFRRYWRQARFTHAAKGQGSRPEDAFQAFGGNFLSRREREIVQLLLRGHSTLSISLHLNISVTTVKTHRKNLYAKLGISSQFELFSLFVDSIGAPVPRPNEIAPPPGG